MVQEVKKPLQLSQQTVRTLKDRCIDMISRVSCIDAIRDEVILPILEYYADPECPGGTLRLPADAVQLARSIIRQGSMLCILANTYRTDLISDITKLNGIIEEEVFSSSAARRNIRNYLHACKEELYMGDAQLFSLENLFSDDTNALAMAVDSAVSMMERIQMIQCINCDDILPRLREHYPLLRVEESMETPLSRSKSSGLPTVRLSVLSELLTSEKRYNADLEALQKFSQEVKIEDALDDTEYDAIFSNLDALVDFQRQFLLQMESKLTPYAMSSIEASYSCGVAELFIENSAGFQVYETFCTNHPRAMETVTESSKKLDLVGTELSVTVIGSYLTKPVQRICKYPLLLKELVKNTDKNAPDYEKLKKALQVTEQVASGVNEAKGREEEARKIDTMKMFGYLPIQLGKLVLIDNLINIDNNQTMNVYLYQERLFLMVSAMQPAKGSSDTALGGSNFLRRNKKLSIKEPSSSNRIVVDTNRIISASKEIGDCLIRISYKDENDSICNLLLKCRDEERQMTWIKKIDELSDAKAKQKRGSGSRLSALVSKPAETPSDTLPLKVQFQNDFYITMVTLPIYTVMQLKKAVADKINAHYRILDEPLRVSSKDMLLTMIDQDGDRVAILEDSDARFAQHFCQKYMHVVAQATIRNIRRNRTSLISQTSSESVPVVTPSNDRISEMQED